MKLLDSHHVATSQSNKTMVGDKPEGRDERGFLSVVHTAKQTNFISVV